MILSAMFMAIGIVLPFFTGQIQSIGNMLLPMHLPVLLCGFICGWKYGLVVGAALPVIRSMWFGMPQMFPNAVSMAFELATYGFVAGWLYSHARWHCVKSLFRCLVVAMLSGRLVWGFVQVVLLGIGGKGFTPAMFIAGAFTNAIPGIIFQLIFIPALMVALGKAKLVPFGKHGKNPGYCTEK